MCDVILQPAPGALQAASRTRLFLSLCNSLAPQHFTATYCWISSPSPFYFFSYRGGCATCWRKHFCGNRDVGICPIHLWYFWENCALLCITPRIPFSLCVSLSISLSTPHPHPSVFLSVSRWLSCLDALRFDGKNQKKRKEDGGNMSGQTGV